MSERRHAEQVQALLPFPNKKENLILAWVLLSCLRIFDEFAQVRINLNQNGINLPITIF